MGFLQGRLRRLAGPLLAAAAAPLAAQHPTWLQDSYSRPALYGTVRDSATGNPADGLLMEVAGRQGAVVTDSSGHYLLFGLPVGEATISFRCTRPAPAAGALAAQRVVPIAAHTDSLAEFAIPLLRCATPEPTTVAGEFRGVYAVGFELSSFEPCSLGGHPAWLTVSMAGRRQRLLWPDVREHGRTRTYYVRARGSLAGPGSYGHMGAYAYELTVDRFLEVEGSPPPSCTRGRR
jgi:hypothetical protein